MVKDPVCGREVDEKTASFKSIHANNLYYFCSTACQTQFNKNPEKYLQGKNKTHHASHYGGYCPTPGCGTPAKGLAWYFYVGLLVLLLLVLFLFSFARFLI